MHDSLAKLKGAAFDKAYIAQTVKAHLQAVALFQKEGKAGQDQDVKAWAAKRLSMLQEHLKMASSIDARVNK
jgi:putative membrane protein